MARDGAFLDATQRYILERQEENHRLNAYMLTGFSLPDPGKPHMLGRSLQSIFRSHIHLSEQLSPDLRISRILQRSAQGDAEQVLLFANLAGAISMDRYAACFSGFGTEVRFCQRVGDAHLERVFGTHRRMHPADPAGPGPRVQYDYPVTGNQGRMGIAGYPEGPDPALRRRRPAQRPCRRRSVA